MLEGKSTGLHGVVFVVLVFTLVLVWHVEWSSEHHPAKASSSLEVPEFLAVHLHRELFELMVPHGARLARDRNPPLVVLAVAKVNSEYALDPLVQSVYSALTMVAAVSNVRPGVLSIETFDVRSSDSSSPGSTGSSSCATDCPPPMSRPVAAARCSGAHQHGRTTKCQPHSVSAVLCNYSCEASPVVWVLRSVLRANFVVEHHPRPTMNALRVGLTGRGPFLTAPRRTSAFFSNTFFLRWCFVGGVRLALTAFCCPLAVSLSCHVDTTLSEDGTHC